MFGFINFIWKNEYEQPRVYYETYICNALNYSKYLSKHQIFIATYNLCKNFIS